MSVRVGRIDREGRVKLPVDILESLGVRPDTEVAIEMTASGVLIRPAIVPTPVTERIGRMELPVAEWSVMEREIEAGRG